MQELTSLLTDWYAGSQPFALATVIHTWGSSPRQPGAAMAVSTRGAAVGSVSGGCVEGAVYELAQETLGGARAATHHFGVSDDDAFAVGLTCGGKIDIFVEAIQPAEFGVFAQLSSAVREHRAVVLTTLIDHPDGVAKHMVLTADQRFGSLGSQRLDDAVADDALGLLAQGHSDTLRYGPAGERRRDEIGVFVESFAPAPRMLVFGAIDFAAAVARIGNFLGYRVTVCDARAVFATTERFPDVQEVVVDWPHRYLRQTAVDERTVICVLTHDPKFDVPLLQVALRTPAAYVGAMGSRRTHEDRLADLKEAGMTDDELARLSSPIGLDIGARTPEETAISIAGEIIAGRWSGSGLRLKDVSGPIHHANRRPSR
jgi:xanthine dehydrogenase accessory factor